MIDGGWIKIHRSVMTWEWWDDRNVRDVWLTILLLANHEPRRWRGQVINAGQLITSRATLAEKTGLSEQAVRTSLTKLKRTGEISIKSTNRYSLITVIKWADYQVTASKSNQQTTSKQPTNNQQATTNKKKRIKELKNIYTFTPPDYIIQQMEGTLPEETPATEDEIQAIKDLQEKMKC